MIMKSVSQAFFQLLMAVVPCAAGPPSAKPTLVELWHVGDDGLSQRLADQVETAFRQSPDLVLSSGRKPGTLVVTIPSNVEWKLVGKRTQVFYSVEFSSTENKTTSKVAGSCWDDDLGKCAAQILRGTKIAAQKHQ